MVTKYLLLAIFLLTACNFQNIETPDNYIITENKSLSSSGHFFEYSLTMEFLKNEPVSGKISTNSGDVINSGISCSGTFSPETCWEINCNNESKKESCDYYEFHTSEEIEQMLDEYLATDNPSPYQEKLIEIRKNEGCEENVLCYKNGIITEFNKRNGAGSYRWKMETINS